MKARKLLYAKDHIKAVCANGCILFDKDDLDIYLENLWRIDRRGYVSTSHGKHLKMHRLILKAKSNQMIDHINGNKSDNRKINLRFCNSSENNCNSKKRKGTSSIYKGVSRIKNAKKNPFLSYIYKDNQRIHLGVFKTEKEAALKYNKFALQYHKEFAKLNEITK